MKTVDVRLLLSDDVDEEQLVAALPRDAVDARGPLVLGATLLAELTVPPRPPRGWTRPTQDRRGDVAVAEGVTWDGWPR